MGVTACEADRDKLQVSISSETTVFGITFKVSPTYLKSGETVRLEVSQVDDEAVQVVLFSESLGFEEPVTTPAVLEKVVEQTGTHDVGFRYETDAVSIERTTIITVE